MLAGIILGSAILLLGACRDRGTQSYAQQTKELRVEIPQSNWVPIFFKDIDRRVEQAKFANLRTAVLPENDLEVRLWFGAASRGIDGITIRRNGGVWSSIYLHGWSQSGETAKNYEELMQTPRSGWDTAWQRLVDSGLLTLPDASQVDCNVMGRDGIAFIVETNVNRTYRTYLYDDPTYAKCDEAKRLLKLIDIVNQEFGSSWVTTN